MQVERRVSGKFVEWLFATARGAPVSARLREAGLDLEQPQSDYAAEQVPGWLQLLSSSLHPSQPAGEALRRTGFEAAQRRPSGQSLQQVMTSLPEKLERLGNFFDVSVRTHGEHRYVAHFDDVNSLPTFFLGVLQGVTSASMTSPPEVVWSPEGLSGARYVVTTKESALNRPR